MHERFIAEPRWRGVRFIKSLLSNAPAAALQLDEFEGDFYADDHDGTPIEDLVPDYSILHHSNYRYAVIDAYFGYASRGCIRNATFVAFRSLKAHNEMLHRSLVSCRTWHGFTGKSASLIRTHLYIARFS